MSKIEVNAIEPQCGTNLTVGASGDTITFPSGTTVVNNGSQTGFGRTGTVDWDTTAKTAGFTAVSGNGYFVNTTSGAVTATLPASPSAGAIVAVADYAGTAATNTITIARNGSNINGAASDLTITKNNSACFLVYVDGTQGWKLTETSNINDIELQPTYIVASGGTTTTCGNYKIHTFTGPGTFTVCSVGNPLGSVDVEYIVVAGGGGGAHYPDGGGCGAGGAGGAGGFRFASSSLAPLCYPAKPLAGSNLPVSATAYPITVGAGGATHPTPTTGPGNPGNNSVFSTITSAGGGAGGNSPFSGGPSNAYGQPGGSGGGGGGTGQPTPTSVGGTGNTPPTSPPQGNNGGNVVQPSGPVYSTAGGGGAISAGGDSNPAAGSAGNGGTGAGVPNAFGTSGENCGSYYYFSGGGGGSAYNAGGAIPTGTGGLGGAGDGASGTGGNGTSNTGGGGGAGGNVTAPGSAGGSGIVIIRYKYQ